MIAVGARRIEQCGGSRNIVVEVANLRSGRRRQQRRVTCCRIGVRWRRPRAGGLQAKPRESRWCPARNAETAGPNDDAGN